MTRRTLRRFSAVVVAIIMVMAVASPAFAGVAKWGTISCPGQPSFAHARWQGNLYIEPPWHYYNNWATYSFSPTNVWQTTERQGEIDGGYWYTLSDYALDSNNTYAYCT
jgi:hypothetical protein